MERQEERGIIQTLSSVNGILGIWLIISPYILSYGSTAKWDQTIIGVVVLILAAIRTAEPRQQWLSFVNGLVGLWAIIAPWALSYVATASYWNEVIVGAVVAILGFWNSGLSIAGHHHHPSHA